jgi:hypothetical protein
MTCFVKGCADQRGRKQAATYRFYYCHRSGRSVSKDGRLRHT